MTELPMDCWAQRREICLTLEEGPGGLSPSTAFHSYIQRGGDAIAAICKTNFGL